MKRKRMEEREGEKNDEPDNGQTRMMKKACWR